jgi:hypothetical protein
MKFACLVYIDPTLTAALTPETGAELANSAIAFDWSLREAGHLLVAQPLQEPQTARTVRVRSGRTIVTDGPFAEAKEVFGGFFLVDAADMAEAEVLAAACPMAAMGSVEIRPFLDQTHSVTGQGRPAPIPW